MAGLGSSVSRSPDPALVFIGFMGAGKSTALAAARLAGLQTTEVDELLEREFGMPVPEIFERHGEEQFRPREADLVSELLGRARGGAIALGGGSILSERVREALAGHVVVWLQIDAAETWRRIEGTPRPLARSEADVTALLAERLPFYEGLADAVIPGRDRGLIERALPALLTLRELPGGTRLLWAASASGEYPVLVGDALLEAAEGKLRSGEWPLPARRFCVTDSVVGPLYAERLEPLAGQVEVEPGEAAKTLAEAERVMRELAGLGMTRSDHLVALGGGVVGDLAGFCAATYQRGVALVHVPTTLVAQVDSAYGGKTGVDIPEAKNYIGAYHLPAAVLVDPSTLATLPREELAAGFAEVIKTGLLAGGALWNQVRAIESPEPDRLAGVIFACARYKCEVVAADERDAGLRAVLNLGHTVGHAIEASTSYRRYRHGEAIGLGLLAALRLSGAEELREEVRGILLRHDLPASLDRGVDTEAVLGAVERDKKRTPDGVGFVLLERPGKPRPGQLVAPDRVRAAVEELQA